MSKLPCRPIGLGTPLPASRGLLACAGLLVLVGCREPKCEPGYGLAADGRCYPIYDPENPPWDDTTGSVDSGDDGGDGGAGAGGPGDGDGGGADAGGDPGGEGEGGTGDPEKPTIDGTYEVSVDAELTTGEYVWIAAWPAFDPDDGIPFDQPPLIDDEYPVVAAGDATGFLLELPGVAAEGIEVSVAAVLVQGDGDEQDDPHGIWAGPGALTPSDSLEGVTVVIR